MNVIKTLPGSNLVVGLTCIGDKLFVLLKRNNDHVEVYSTKTSQNFARLRQFSLAGLDTRHCNDMTSCARRRCLYISDWKNSCVHLSALNGTLIAKWSVPGPPVGISLTPREIVLVTCRNSRILMELDLSSESGQCIRQVDYSRTLRDRGTPCNYLVSSTLSCT